MSPAARKKRAKAPAETPPKETVAPEASEGAPTLESPESPAAPPNAQGAVYAGPPSTRGAPGYDAEGHPDADVGRG